MDKVIIFDTTLRDGEQAAGAMLNMEEKLEIAKQLEKLGVDVIEAGFPIASPGDFEAVREIARTVRGATICPRRLPGAIERESRTRDEIVLFYCAVLSVGSVSSIALPLLWSFWRAPLSASGSGRPSVPAFSSMDRPSLAM